MENKEKIILHLCASEFGSDSKPYRNAGYTVIYVDEKTDVRKFTPPEMFMGLSPTHLAPCFP